MTVPSMFLKKELGIQSALVIPNGVDIPRKIKTSYALAEKSPTIGILTNFHFRPKAEGVVRLARIIRNTTADAKLVVGGSGSFLEEYMKKTTAIHANTEFLGRCEKEDLFSRIDIFAYYSLFDNQPNAILEAMASGLPVLSNDIGAVREIMEGALRKYLCGNEDSYRKTILELVSSEEERRRCATSALARAHDFDKDAIIRKYTELYG
jgi:glycosyltransferase involved in cell wall biosynthesis